MAEQPIHALRMPNETRDRIRAVAPDRSFSGVVREALDGWLAEQEKNSKNPTQERKN